MSGWSRPRKRLLLAAMLLPWPLVVAACALTGVLLREQGGPEWAANTIMGCFLGGVVISFVTGLACIADASGDRRVEQRAGWMAGLLLAPTVAGPAYWWLHVRPAPGEPHGLQTLAPAWTWSRRTKALTGLGAAFVLLFFAAYIAWFATIFVDFGLAERLAVAVFAVFGVWAVVAAAVLGLFFLDALREGGVHAWLWGVLLILLWPVAAPLYWVLYVRPTGPPDGGP